MASAVVRRTRHAIEQILIGKIPADPYQGRWTFPGGPVEVGEMPEVRLRRALQSLLGASVTVRHGQPPFDHAWDDVVCRWRFFFCDATDAELINHYFAEVRWIVRGDLCEYDFDPVSQRVVDWMLEEEAPRHPD